MASATHLSATPAPLGPLALLREGTIAGIARRRALLGYLFLIPTIFGILTFTAGPVLVSLGLSFFKWDVFSSPVFTGLDNYQRFLHDQQALTSFGNTLKFVVMAVTVQICLALFLALSIQRITNRLLRYYFRTAFFLPILMSGASVSITIAYLFNKDFGVVNYYLSFLHIARIPWLTSSSWALITIVIAAVWHNVGFTLILFIGGLAGISQEVLEAADLDGARGWQRLRWVTLPLLSPTIFFAAVTGVIGALQVFDEPYVMTRGGPGDASRSAVMVVYQSAFQQQELGYGSTVVVILFILIMLVTLIQFVGSRRWVFYQ